MVEEDLERDEDEEYMSDMVIIMLLLIFCRLIKVKPNWSIAFETKNTLR